MTRLTDLCSDPKGTRKSWRTWGLTESGEKKRIENGEGHFDGSNCLQGKQTASVAGDAKGGEESMTGGRVWVHGETGGGVSGAGKE